MTDWIDFTVYAIFFSVVWFPGSRAVARSALLLALDRNADWLSQHPESAARIRQSRGYLRTCHALGVASLALLTACQLGFWPAALSAPRFEPEHWLVLKDLNTLLIVPVLLFYFGSGFLFARWLQTVPLAEQRSASLVPRSIDDLVPRPFRLATYLAIAAHLAAWIAAGIWLTYESPELWARNASQFGGAALAAIATHAVMLWVARASVVRRPNTLDRTFGLVLRRNEVRAMFALNWLPPITGTLRLLGELGNTAFDFARLANLGIIVGVLVFFALSSRPKDLARSTGGRGEAPSQASRNDARSPVEALRSE